MGKLHKAKKNCPNWVLSDQIFLGTVRQEARPSERQPKTLKTKLAQGGVIRIEFTQIKWPKGELENNSSMPRDPTKNMHSDSLKMGQLTLSQGKVKKGDDVACFSVQCFTRLSDSDTVY